MKQVRTVFPPARLYDVVTALRTVPTMPLFTMTEVRGFPSAANEGNSPRQESPEIGSVEMIEIEFVVPETMLSRVMDAIGVAAATSGGDDFLLFVSEVMEVAVTRSAHE